MKKPLISIIVPVYNSESYIADTIQSCIDQTYDHFELLLVNDGSTDNTEAVIHRFTDERIRYFKTQNAGGCNARNFGISQAKGQLFQFLDHDDVLDKGKLAAQVPHFEKYGSDYLYSGTMGTVSGTRRTIDTGFELYQKDFSPQQFFEEKFTQFGRDIVTGAWLVPQKLVQSTHGWDPGAGLNDDGEYFMRLILHSKGIIYCREAVFYFRRDVPNSLSKQFGSKEVYAKWLNSYRSYVKHFLETFDSRKARELGCNALSVYYCSAYPHYPDLLAQCRLEMKALGYRHPLPQGGTLFNKVAGWIGVEATLKLWEFRKQWLKK